ncbi:MAG TPA: hypothetical protein VGN07_17380 [Steroidobacteraceae bacterium]|jgi:hypothetical protein
MKVTVAFIALILWAAANEADVVYIEPPEEMGLSIQALDQKSFRDEVEQYARAAGESVLIEASIGGSRSELGPAIPNRVRISIPRGLPIY